MKAEDSLDTLFWKMIFFLCKKGEPFKSDISALQGRAPGEGNKQVTLMDTGNPNHSEKMPRGEASFWDECVMFA